MVSGHCLKSAFRTRRRRQTSGEIAQIDEKAQVREEEALEKLRRRRRRNHQKVRSVLETAQEEAEEEEAEAVIEECTDDDEWHLVRHCLCLTDQKN